MSDLRQLQRVANRVFDTTSWDSSSRTSTKVSDTGADIYLQLPGYDESQLEVEAIRDRVTVKASAPSEDAANSDNDEQQVVQRGFSNQAFEKRFKLPFEVDPAQTKANFEDGILHLSFAKPASQQARNIPIDIAE